MTPNSWMVVLAAETWQFLVMGLVVIYMIAQALLKSKQEKQQADPGLAGSATSQAQAGTGATMNPLEALAKRRRNELEEILRMPATDLQAVPVSPPQAPAATPADQGQKSTTRLAQTPTQAGADLGNPGWLEGLQGRQWRRAVVLKEILDPPVAMRENPVGQ